MKSKMLSIVALVCVLGSVMSPLSSMVDTKENSNIAVPSSNQNFTEVRSLIHL